MQLTAANTYTMASSIKLRTTIKDDLTTVNCIIRHPMHNGAFKDPETGKIIPAHYIENVTVYHNEKLLLHCDWSRAVSKNPYFSFSFAGANAGDFIQIAWIDNKGEEGSAEAAIRE